MQELTLTPEAVEERLVIVPEWIALVLADARSKGKLVDYTCQVTPFGTFPMTVEVSDVDSWS